MRETDTATIVWIGGEAYAPNHPKAKAYHGKPVAQLRPPEPQRNLSRPLEPADQAQKRSKAGGSAVCVLLVRYGRKRLDDDNLAASYKATRDALAEHLETDDGSPVIRWEYQQVTTTGATGTSVVISTL